MIDNKGKLFGKINIIDFIVVLIIAIAVILSAIKFNINPVKNNVNETTFQYTLEVKGVRNFTVDAFQKGDLIYEGKTENLLGTIVDIKTTHAQKYLADATGEIVLAEVPEQYDLSLTIECNGVKSDKGLETPTGEKISLNKTINIFNKYCKTDFYVKNINE